MISRTRAIALMEIRETIRLSYFPGRSYLYYRGGTGQVVGIKYTEASLSTIFKTAIASGLSELPVFNITIIERTHQRPSAPYLLGR